MSSPSSIGARRNGPQVANRTRDSRAGEGIVRSVPYAERGHHESRHLAEHAHEGSAHDASVLAEHVALGALAEPLGFNSLFALEHHFTGYLMSPDPTQLLTYFAGRTRRITLGTAVIVLPWHDPVRVAEEIALLDILSHGRCVFGFGRGAASVEYAGFRVPMEEARARFVESAQIVIKALTNDVFSWEGEFFKIPTMSIRPRPISHPERRFYASSVSPESAEIMAKLRFGLLVIMQNEWPKAAEDIQRIRLTGITEPRNF